MSDVIHQGPGGYEVNALRLLRVVHVRRGLRLAVRLAVLGLLICLLAGGLSQEVLDSGSRVRLWMSACSSVGLVLLTVVFVVSFLTQLVLRYVGFVGRVAAALVPVLGSTGTVVVHHGQEYVLGLVPQLGRRPAMSFPVVIALGFGVMVSCLSAVDIGPAWRASMGYGGEQVTIGADASISRTEDNGFRGSPRHFLNTPLGEVRANGDPKKGEHWIVVPDDGWGNVEAYRVGGFNYVMLGALGAGGVLMMVGAVAYEIFRRTGRPSRQVGAAALAASLRALSVGNRARLQVWLTERPERQHAAKPRTREFVVGCPPDLRNPMGNR